MSRRSLEILLFISVLSAPTLLGASSADGPLLKIPATAGERCVEPTPLMRREHMKLLLEQRDRTVHQGIRAAAHSLVGCVDCHANRDAAGKAISVDAPGEFCESCHRFAGIRMDCFGCHASRPDE